MNEMAVWWPTHIQDRNSKSRIPHPLDLLGKGADHCPPRFTPQKRRPMGWNTGFFRDLYMQSQAWGSIEYPECNEDRWGHVSCIECDSEYDDRKHLCFTSSNRTATPETQHPGSSPGLRCLLSSRTSHSRMPLHPLCRYPDQFYGGNSPKVVINRTFLCHI